MGETSNENVSGNEDVEALKADIDQTRENIGQTLEAIGERLSPGNMVQEAAETVRAAAARKVETVMTTASERASDLADQARGTVETVRRQVSDNTMPAALVAIGLGWYAFRAFRRGNRRESYGSYGSQSPRWADDRDNRWNAMDERWSGEEWRDQNYDAGNGDWQTGAQRLMQRLGDLSARAGSEVSRVIRQNPLAVGVAAAAVGVAIGLTVPETDVENRVLGETRDAVVDRAREAVAHPRG
jgi:ElaB/YqjD/DUF883 family membrane-anchored ribosome-binding protein